MSNRNIWLSIIIILITILFYFLLNKNDKIEYFSNNLDIWLYYGSWCSGNSSVYGGSIINSVSSGTSAVCVSFANWIFNEQGQNMGIQNWLEAPPVSDGTIQQYVTDIHKQGAKAILSFGGSAYPFPFSDIPQNLVSNIVNFVNKFEFDGIDLDIENTDNSSDDILFTFAQSLRNALPSNITMNFSIMSTVPSKNLSPWKKIMSNGSSIFTTIGIQCYNSGDSNYNPTNDVNALIQMGWKPSQILIGVMPGSDNVNQNTTTDTITSWKNNIIVPMGLRGFFMWSVSRDTKNTNPCNSGDPPAGQTDGYYTNFLLSIK